MSNYIICVACNGLVMTQKAVESFLSQDIEGGVEVLLVCNGAVDPLYRHPWPKGVTTIAFCPRYSLSGVWNMALKVVFRHSDKVLVVNNDVVLRADTYRLLDADGGGFVTAVGEDNPIKVMRSKPQPDSKRPHPDFSCFLIRRSVVERVGYFNEQFAGAYCEDSEFHVRMHRAGVEAYCIGVPFYHIGSGTLKASGDERERHQIQLQADANRELFKSMFGCLPGTPEYSALFS